MPYNIVVRVFQNHTDEWFSIVEKTVWYFGNGGTWTEHNNGEQVLTMNGSGTSGVLRFRSANSGENFIVALGVHNYQRWCDIVSNIGDGETAMLLHPQYYNGGFREYQREKQLASYSGPNNRGRPLSVHFTSPDVNDLRCNIVIGAATH